MRHVLGDKIALSGLNFRQALPGSGHQSFHTDWGPNPDALNDPPEFSVCNSLWMLDDFTAENGAVRYVPGTHLSGQLPADVLSTPEAEHPDQKLVTGRAGTVLVMNAHLWHGGLPNLTENPRRALHIFFARSDHPQPQYQTQLLREETQAALTPGQRKILALDDPLNDVLSRDPAVRSGFLK